MDNFIYGLKAVWESGSVLLNQMIKYQVFWGFLIGFFAATMVYGFLMTEHPRQVASVLFQEKSKSFERWGKRRDDGTFSESFYAFSQKAERIKAAFLLAVLTLILFILITIVSF